MHRISKVLATGIAGIAMLGGALIFVVPTAASAAPANAATVSTAVGTCTWRYVVTDGVPKQRADLLGPRLELGRGCDRSQPVLLRPLPDDPRRGAARDAHAGDTLPRVGELWRLDSVRQLPVGAASAASD
jgi:hypothetical protein